MVCLQEVSPLSFETDFAFMKDDLGYDGYEMFRKGRFRPATFWRTSRCDLVSPPVHRDRTLLTTFRIADADGAGGGGGGEASRNWHVLNCHLQAGKEGGRRVRQIHDGVDAAFKLAKKLKGEILSPLSSPLPSPPNVTTPITPPPSSSVATLGPSSGRAPLSACIR